MAVKQSIIVASVFLVVLFVNEGEQIFISFVGPHKRPDLTSTHYFFMLCCLWIIIRIKTLCAILAY